MLLLRDIHYSLLLIYRGCLPKAHNLCLKIDINLKVPDKGRHKMWVAKDIEGQS